MISVGFLITLGPLSLGFYKHKENREIYVERLDFKKRNIWISILPHDISKRLISMYHLRLLFPISILFYFNVSTLSAMSFGEFLNIKSSTFYQTSMDKTDQNWRFVSSDDFSKIYLKEDSKKILWQMKKILKMKNTHSS